jgi:RNA polymerase sigma factor (sigma-70 family)
MVELLLGSVGRLPMYPTPIGWAELRDCNKDQVTSVKGVEVRGWTQEEEWAMWMRAAISGDAGAYRRFLVSVTPNVRSMARRRYRAVGASDSDAEDLVQEVLLTIHLKRGTWDKSRPIGPWIAAIVRNKLIDTLRRRGRRNVVPIDEVMDTLGIEDQGDSLAHRDIDKLLKRLKIQQRDIVQSISINGNSIRETADLLHMTEGAVRVALHRALRRLAALYRSQPS